MTITIPDHIRLDSGTLRFLQKEKSLLVGYETREVSDSFPAYNPATGELLCELPIAGKDEVDAMVRSAREAFEKVWRDGVTPARKATLLWRLADLMERDKQVLMELETLDNGKSLSNSRYDVESAIAHFRYYSGWATKIEGSSLNTGSGRSVSTRREALGVTALIVPWNFPLMIASWKLAPALACGNTCILKPAEQTSLTALYLLELIREAGFPAGVVSVATGPGNPTGEALCLHMDVDKVSFTGSTRVGRLIMKMASESNLKRVSLELGGKSPNIVFADSDLEKVKESILWTSFYNSGQECTLGSRLYIQDTVYESVLEDLCKRASGLRLGNGLEDPDLGPMISEAQLKAVQEKIDKGVKDGADLLMGGRRCLGELKDGFFLPPTIFTHRNDTIDLVQEEIFGPVVAVSAFRDEEEVISRANDSKYGLAAAVWTNDLSKAHRCVHDLEAGTVWVNGYDMFDASVPFGGFRQSGIGKEMGRSAIELYTREKAVWIAF